MSQNENRRTMKERVRFAVIDVWVSGEGDPSFGDVARATSKDGAPPLSESTVLKYVGEWKKAGLAKTQSTFFNSGSTLWAYLGGASEEATLRDVVAHGLEILPPAAAAQLRTAVRFLFGLEYQAEESVILASAESIPATELHTVPGRVYQECLNGGSTKATARNLRSVTRRAMRLAAEEELVPVYLPRIREDDEWEAALHKYLGPDAPGIVSKTRTVYGTYWRRLAKVAREVHGEDASPGTLTRSQAEDIRHHLKRQGLPRVARTVIQVLRYVGRKYGEGPYSELLQADPNVKGNGATPKEGYLVAKDGTAARCCWDDLTHTLRDHGFPEEWMEFVEWYARYLTVPDEEIHEHSDIPVDRPASRVVGSGAVTYRIISARAWAYHAIEAFRDEYDLGPGEIPLHRAFGTDADLIAQRVQAWWAARAKRGEVAAPHSTGLRLILIGASMFARAMYDRSLHGRWLTLVDEHGELRSNTDEEGRGKTPKEEAWWRAYRTLAARVQRLELARRRSDDGHVSTDVKDIQKVIVQTPPAYWSALQDELLRQLKEAKHRGETDTPEYHRTVRLAFVTGALISTGFRIGELCHVRLGQYRHGPQEEVRDRQYGPGNRAQRLIRLRPVDRKNTRSHTAYLRERYCPAWLESMWLDETRPHYLANSSEDHDWLLVHPNGKPYGCPEEADDGSGRDDESLAQRKGGFTTWWKEWLMPVAVDLGLKVPTGPYEFTPHIIRNVFGYLLYQTHPQGEQAAASYLGDMPDTIQGAYAAIQGIHVDVSDADVRGLGFICEEGTAEPQTEGAVQDSPTISQQIFKLNDLRKEGGLSETLYRAALQELEGKISK